MRLKHVKGAEEKIAQSPYVLPEDGAYAGKWQALFGNAHPIHIEIGMGKGQFLLEQALRFPERNFVGIEKYSSVLLRAVQKRAQAPYEALENVRLLRMDAEDIATVFAPGEAEKIYLNFSDPWPKDRHTKRRLTSGTFLARYERILAPNGLVECKTDNVPLFVFSLEEAKRRGWELLLATRDLHADAAACQGNIPTEYEEKFSAAGHPICKMVIRRPDGTQAAL